jgi:hypothetical protein
LGAGCPLRAVVVFFKMRTYFIFYRSFYESINDLPEFQQLELYKAIFELSLNDSEPKLTGISKSIFTLIRPQIVANNQRFKNGSKAKAKRNGSEIEAKKKQTESETEANKNKNKNKNENKNKNKKENKNFEPPTLEEVKSWFIENGSTAEAGAKAWQYYTDGNWNDSKGQPVKNWRQKMRGGRWLEPKPNAKPQTDEQYRQLDRELVPGSDILYKYNPHG